MRRAALPAALALLVLALASAVASPAAAQDSSASAPAAARRITKMPRLVKFVDAEYPAAKKAAGVSAAVILTIDITPTGAVKEVSVATSAGDDFDAAAVDAARRFEFEPAEVDGKPVAAKITYRYSFVASTASVADSRQPTVDSTSKSPMPGDAAASGPAPGPAPGASPAPPAPAPRAGEPVTVTVRAEPAHRESVATGVRASEARRVAGTQGDVLKVVQSLPGVARPPLASGQIVVWGAGADGTRTYVDGVEIPALYHGSALRSTLNSDLVSNVELVPGAYGADYGRALGGLVRVETRPLPREGIHGYAAADTLDASAMVAASVAPGASAAVAARQSWLDGVLDAVGAKDTGDTFPIPRYRDYQAKASFDVAPRETVDVVFLGSRDDLRRVVASADPAATRSETTSSEFHRLYLVYTRNNVQITPYIGRDASDLATAFGGQPTSLTSRAWRYGVRATERAPLTRDVDLTLGLDAAGTSTDLSRTGTLTLPPREGDVAVFGQPPASDFAADTWSASVVDVGPFAFADVRAGPFTFTPGVRVDGVLIEGDRKTPRVGSTPPVGFSRLESAVDPRLAVRWRVGPRLVVTASGGVYHQPPDPADLSAVFGTPDLALSRATHLALGQATRVAESLTAETTVFAESMSDLVVRSRLPTPNLARALVQDGEGRSYGVQMLLRKSLSRGAFGWVSYTISRSERRYVGDARWRLFDVDEPHVLAVVASQALGRWTFGARFRYTTGAPRTPVVGSFYDAKDDAYQPVFGAQSSTRLPPFYQLDVRVERVVPLGPRVRASLYLDLLNVTFHTNDEEVVYDAAFRDRGYITGLPTLAVAGVRVEL